MTLEYTVLQELLCIIKALPRIAVACVAWCPAPFRDEIDFMAKQRQRVDGVDGPSAWRCDDSDDYDTSAQLVHCNALLGHILSHHITRPPLANAVLLFWRALLSRCGRAGHSTFDLSLHSIYIQQEDAIMKDE